MPTRILVCDADPDARELFVTLIEGAGYEVVAVPGGERALKVCEETDLALVLWTVSLPTLERAMVREQFRLMSAAVAPGRIGVVTTSIHWSEEDFPSVAFIRMKPVDMTDVLALVAEYAQPRPVLPAQREIVERYFTELSRADWAAFARLCAENVIYHLPGEARRGQSIEGRNAFQNFTRETFASFPGARFEILNVYGLPQPNVVVARYEATWLDAAACRRDLQGAVVFTFHDGEIAAIGVRLPVEATEADQPVSSAGNHSLVKPSS